MKPSVLLFMFLAIPAAGLAEDASSSAEYVRANYTKFEYRVPMRDGKQLFTAVYIPNDQSQSYPILLYRTPYSIGPYGADRYKDSLGPNEAFQEDGYIFAYQDVRGRFMSEGDFVNMRPHLDVKRNDNDVDESSDTYDTIEWLMNNVSNHNGKVGQWGISYPGFYSSAGAIDSHAALVAVSPQAPIADWFWDDMHQHGAFILPLAFNFFSTFGQPRKELTTEWPERFDHKTADGYQFFLNLGPLRNANEKHLHREIPFWNEITKHPNYDEFWQSRNILPHLKNIRAATMVVGGWYDTEDLYGPLKTYAAIENQNPEANNMLVMGPWMHGGWGKTDGEFLGTADFGFKTAKYYRERVELPFFQHHLKSADDPRLPEALVFETGANRWRSFDAWPPNGRHSRSAYLHEGEGLKWNPPDSEEGACDEYLSDPEKPVPYTMEITTNWAKNYMTEDQRFASWRPDVLVYQSEVLTEDLTIAGPVLAKLWVSTTGTASDFIVKVIDVYPNEMPENSDRDDRNSGNERNLGATQRLVRGGVFRGRFRESYEVPKPFVPNEVAEVSFELLDILHTFQRDHRLMVQIQSSWFPFVDRNPQKYVPNIFEATDADFIKANNRIYRSAKYPSHLKFGVLGQLPRHGG